MNIHWTWIAAALALLLLAGLAVAAVLGDSPCPVCRRRVHHPRCSWRGL